MMPDAELAWRRWVVRWALVSLALIVLACVVSGGFLHPDEYFQTIEFAALKLGRTDPSALPWEYAARIRPWLQPALYVALAKGAMAAGIVNPFHQVLLFRLFGGLCLWLAILALMRSAKPLEASVRRWMVASLACLWYLPYLAARTSSETLSASFLALGLCCLLPTTGKVDGGAPELPPARFLLAGALLGVSFSFRYQAAFAALGVGLWVLFTARATPLTALARATLLVAGFAGPLALSLPIDHWGYGSWSFPPWNYFYENIVAHRAAAFGTKPFWYYFILLNRSAAAPLTVLLTAAFAIFAVRFPRHPFTWASVALFLCHSAVGHKELRFLFPLMLPAAFFIPMAFGQPGPRGAAVFAKIWAQRGRWPGRILVAVNGAALLALLLTAPVRQLTAQRYLRHDLPGGGVVHCSADPFLFGPLRMGFHRHPDDQVRVVDGPGLAATVAASRAPVYYLHDGLTLPEGVGGKATRLHGSAPAWISRFNFGGWVDRLRLVTAWRIEPPSGAREK
ncbi:MAG: hypothetical protein J0L75_11755 [Spirochaetes bacterium]|nr:hypothetical protein [Spirochaetota bacterium]